MLLKGVLYSVTFFKVSIFRILKKKIQTQTIAGLRFSFLVGGWTTQTKNII